MSNVWYRGCFILHILKMLLDVVWGNVCTEFQVCIFFRLVRRRDTNKWRNTYTHLKVKIGISPTGCSLHVDLIVKILLFNKIIFYKVFNDCFFCKCPFFATPVLPIPHYQLPALRYWLEIKMGGPLILSSCV